MADTEKNYTSKLNIGGTVFYLKDADAQSAISLLNGAKTVSGSVLNAIKLNAADADYQETTLGAALGVAESQLAVLIANQNTNGSVDFKVYNNAKNAIYSSTPAVTHAATAEDVAAGLATEIGETVIDTPAQVVTLAEAIQNAADNINSLKVNNISPDASGNITIDAGDILRENDATKTVEASFTALETAVDTLNGNVSTEGSVLKTVKDNAKDATYSAATTEYTAKEGEPAVGDFYLNNEEYVEITSDNIASVPANADLFTATNVPAKTIAQAIAANTAANTALAARVTANEGAITTLNGNASTAGSVAYTVKTTGGDAITKLDPNGEDTTITLAIQALQSALTSSNKGQFKVVYAVDKANGTITEANGDEPEAIGASNLGYIYLVQHTGANNGAGQNVGTHYDEFVVVNTGTDVLPTYVLEKLGDTEITLEGYATQTWVMDNAKLATYTAAVAATYKAATEYDAGTTYYSDANGTVADPQPSSETGIGNYFVVDTPAVSAMTIADAIADAISKINAEKVRAQQAEGALDTRVTAVEDAAAYSVNNKTVDTGTNNVTITSTDINHTKTVNNVTYEAASVQTVAADKYVYVGDEYVLVTADDIANGTYADYAGTVYDRVVTPTQTTTTVGAELVALNTAISNETSRATTAEGGLAADIAALQAQVNGQTVTSVNGKEATNENGGAVVIDSSDIVNDAATTKTVGVWLKEDGGYFASSMAATTQPAGTAGTPVTIGDVVVNNGTWYNETSGNWYEVTALTSSAFTLAGTAVSDASLVSTLNAIDKNIIQYVPYTVPVAEKTIADAIDDLRDDVADVKDNTVSLTVNNVAATVTGNFGTGVTIVENIDAGDIPLDKTLSGSVSVKQKLNSILGSTGTALTSASITSGTGTFAVDSNDAEMLIYTAPTLTTGSATFLAPVA